MLQRHRKTTILIRMANRNSRSVGCCPYGKSGYRCRSVNRRPAQSVEGPRLPRSKFIQAICNAYPDHAAGAGAGVLGRVPETKRGLENARERICLTLFATDYLATNV